MKEMTMTLSSWCAGRRARFLSNRPIVFDRPRLFASKNGASASSSKLPRASLVTAAEMNFSPRRRPLLLCYRSMPRGFSSASGLRRRGIIVDLTADWKGGRIQDHQSGERLFFYTRECRERWVRPGDEVEYTIVEGKSKRKAEGATTTNTSTAATSSTDGTRGSDVSDEHDGDNSNKTSGEFQITANGRSEDHHHHHHGDPNARSETHLNEPQRSYKYVKKVTGGSGSIRVTIPRKKTFTPNIIPPPNNGFATHGGQLHAHCSTPGYASTSSSSTHSPLSTTDSSTTGSSSTTTTIVYQRRRPHRGREKTKSSKSSTGCSGKNKSPRRSSRSSSTDGAFWRWAKPPIGVKRRTFDFETILDDSGRPRSAPITPERNPYEPRETEGEGSFSPEDALAESAFQIDQAEEGGWAAFFSRRRTGKIVQLTKNGGAIQPEGKCGRGHRVTFAASGKFILNDTVSYSLRPNLKRENQNVAVDIAIIDKAGDGDASSDATSEDHISDLDEGESDRLQTRKDEHDEKTKVEDASTPVNLNEGTTLLQPHAKK
ncbi:unnamed protein product [Amoebophrya sp. A25]|nr:unnamed protein product [Amoebophrya sp. A25]|eukprot:GSA25T00025661001.1